MRGLASTCIMCRLSRPTVALRKSSTPSIRRCERLTRVAAVLPLLCLSYDLRLSEVFCNAEDGGEVDCNLYRSRERASDGGSYTPMPFVTRGACVNAHVNF